MDAIFPPSTTSPRRCGPTKRTIIARLFAFPATTTKAFNLPHFRAVLLRGIAWAGKRDADLLASKEELASLRYPEGGPTAPEKAAKKIVVPPDFNINLVASEPLIEKPISMDWDPKGRLWIAETPEYPFRKDRSRPPRDRISILEDTHDDGRMDKRTVFYEGLGFGHQHGALSRRCDCFPSADIYTGCATRKAKAQADTKEILYTGFGTQRHPRGDQQSALGHGWLDLCDGGLQQGRHLFRRRQERISDESTMA